MKSVPREKFAAMLEAGSAGANQIEYHAQSLAEAMLRLHGGSWSTVIDHDSQFIAICQDDFGPRREASR